MTAAGHAIRVATASHTRGSNSTTCDAADMTAASHAVRVATARYARRGNSATRDAADVTAASHTRGSNSTTCDAADMTAAGNTVRVTTASHAGSTVAATRYARCTVAAARHTAGEHNTAQCGLRPTNLYCTAYGRRYRATRHQRCQLNGNPADNSRSDSSVHLLNLAVEENLAGTRNVQPPVSNRRGDDLPIRSRRADYRGEITNIEIRGTC
jgi:hypothetical protein